MKIAVTGGAGFIGSNIVDYLVKENHQVIIIDNLSKGKKEYINSKARFYNCDVTNLDALSVIFDIERPEVVIHHAAQINIQESIKNPAFDAATNIGGTINVLECCKRFSVGKIIYSSSAAVYGNPKYLPINEEHPISPQSFYGISKYTPEYYIKLFSELYGIKYTIFRYANVYGIRQDAKGEGGVISIFIDKLLDNDIPVIFGDGEQTRDFIYVKDVAKANILALTKGHNEIINISTNKAVTVNELYNSIKEIIDTDIEAVYKESRRGDIVHSYLNNNKAERILGWNYDYDLERGIKETVDYYSQFNENS